MYEKVKLGKRLGIILIDYLIFFVVAALVSNLITRVVMGDLVIPKELEAWLNNDGSSSEELLDLIQNNPAVAEYFNRELSAILYTFLVWIVAFSFYFIVLPLVWKKQTLGRFLLHVKLVDSEGEKAKFGTLFIREIVGNLLIGSVLSLCCCIPFVANIILLLAKNSIIADMLANTKFIDLDKEIVLSEPEEAGEVEVIEE